MGILAINKIRYNRELFKESVAHQSPIHNFAESIYLGALEPDTCKKLITKPMNFLGLKCFKFFQEIIAITGSRANLIATICDQVVKNAPGKWYNY